MTQKIHIEVQKQEDRELILELAKRLGLKWNISPDPADFGPDLPALRQIIRAGVDTSRNRLDELISRNEGDREDRELPFTNP